MTTTTSLGNELLDRLTAKDWNGVTAMLAPNVHFRGVTPKKFLEFDDRAEVVEQYRKWYDAQIDGVEDFEDGAIEQRRRMRYSVYWTNEEAQKMVFEQAVYYESDDTGITWIELMCSGHLPATS